MQVVSYSPMLLNHADREAAASSPKTASLKCFAAFPKLRSLSICMDFRRCWSLQLDAALEGTHHALCYPHFRFTSVGIKVNKGW